MQRMVGRETGSSTADIGALESSCVGSGQPGRPEDVSQGYSCGFRRARVQQECVGRSCEQQKSLQLTPEGMPAASESYQQSLKKSSSGAAERGRRQRMPACGATLGHRPWQQRVHSWGTFHGQDSGAPWLEVLVHEPVWLRCGSCHGVPSFIPIECRASRPCGAARRTCECSAPLRQSPLCWGAAELACQQALGCGGVSWSGATSAASVALLMTTAVSGRGVLVLGGASGTRL